VKIPKQEVKAIRSKLEKDICVLIFTYSKHNKLLTRVLTKLNNIDIYKIVSFNCRNIPPPSESYKLADVILTTHPTPRNVNYPWFWHMKSTSALANEFNFKYAFVICGDTYVGNPEKIWELPEILGSDDLLSYAYMRGAIGTFTWFSKVSALLEIVSWLNENWDGPGGAVGVKLRKAVNDKDLKLKLYDDMMEYKRFIVNESKRERRKDNPKESFLVNHLGLVHLKGE